MGNGLGCSPLADEEDILKGLVGCQGPGRLPDPALLCVRGGNKLLPAGEGGLGGKVGSHPDALKSGSIGSL